MESIDGTPDCIVLRHGPDIPHEYWAQWLEGRWIDRAHAPIGPGAQISSSRAVAEPTGRFEVRDDGAVAEVWEVRLTAPNERRAPWLRDR